MSAYGDGFSVERDVTWNHLQRCVVNFPVDSSGPEFWVASKFPCGIMELRHLFGVVEPLDLAGFGLGPGTGTGIVEHSDVGHFLHS